MITARLGGAGDLQLYAPVRGLASEVPPLLAALERSPPSVLGLGVSPDELRGLLDYFVNATAEPVVPLTTAERSEIRGLVRFGEVRVPNPAFVELLRWAREVPVEALDPTEDRTANLFADHIGYVELVRRTVRERRVSRSPPAPTTPDEYALEWDRSVAGGRGSRNFAAARDRHLVRAARLLATRHPRVAVVVDRERFESVRSLLAAPDPGSLDPI
ncbi:MAG: hypothetical protein ACLPZM_06315 [Thermoplasmata archaeon]